MDGCAEEGALKYEVGVDGASGAEVVIDHRGRAAEISLVVQRGERGEDLGEGDHGGDGTVCLAAWAIVGHGDLRLLEVGFGGDQPWRGTAVEKVAQVDELGVGGSAW